MAIEILVRTTDAGLGARQRGDIISLKPVPNVGWGKEEDLPNYLIIRVNGVDFVEFRQYCGRHQFLDCDNAETSARRRCSHKINLDNLSINYEETPPHLTVNKNIVINNLITKAFS